MAEETGDTSAVQHEQGKDTPSLQITTQTDPTAEPLTNLSGDAQDGDQPVFAADTDWSLVGRSRSQKRQKVSSSGASLDSFKTLDIHEKLAVLYTDMHNQNDKVANIEHKLDSCLRLHSRVNTIEANMGDVDRRLLLLEYKSLDIEARGRRKNLIFMGFEEDRSENCKIKIESFIEKTLILESFTIDRVHRLGRYKRGSHRPIIVAFRDYEAVESVLSNAYKLKGSRISINKDFPREIVDARKALWRQFKELKLQNPNSKVSLVYPAKIIKDGRVIHDMFPLWDNIMSGSRIQINQRPQANVRGANAPRVETRAQNNSHTSENGPVNGIQRNDSLTADASRNLIPQGDSQQPNPPRTCATGRQSRASPVRSESRKRSSRSPLRRSFAAATRTRERSRSIPPRRHNHSADSSIHRPWDPNDTPQSTRQYPARH